MEPENGGPLEKEIPDLETIHFQVPAVNFWGSIWRIEQGESHLPVKTYRIGVFCSYRIWCCKVNRECVEQNASLSLNTKFNSPPYGEAKNNINIATMTAEMENLQVRQVLLKSLNNDFRCITSALYTSLHHIPYTPPETKHGSPRFLFISGFWFSFRAWVFYDFFLRFGAQ